MEDYSHSRELATIVHLGHKFHVVRRRFEGKTWRKYLTLIHNGVSMSDSFPPTPDDLDNCVAYWTARLRNAFPDSEYGRDAMAKGIAHMRAKQGIAP